MKQSAKLNASQRAQIHALELGIKALLDWRRKHYAMGEEAYRKGIRASKIEGDGITGNAFAWVEEGHKHYIEYSEAVRQLEDMIEIIQDPGVTIEATQEKLL